MIIDQLAMGTWPFLFIWLVLVAYLLPDGRPASQFWQRWIACGLVGVAVFAVGATGDAAGFAETHDGADLPLPWISPALSAVLGVAGLIGIVLLLVGGPVSVWLRLRVATGEARTQLLWLVWGALLVPVTLVAGWVNHFLLADLNLVFEVLLALMATGLPTVMAVAVVKHRLLDIELVLSRTVTYGVLTALVIGGYVGLLTLATQLFGSSTPGGIVAVALVAVAATPVHSRLRAGVNRWVYGYRSEPHQALRLLSANTESADPLAILPAITDTVAEALRVDSVWIEADSSAGASTDEVTRVPLVHQGVALGVLAIGLPAGREFSQADRDLLSDLARQAAVLVHAGQLAQELQTSRTQIVAAREEERRRLRRDLHDGIGPSLAAMVLKLNAAEARTDPAERQALLAEIREEVRSSIGEIRRVVDDLRPPSLDEVGLIGAIRQRAAALGTDSLRFDIRAPEPLPPLPAAVEVAAFRIVSEAMTNCARHSGASRCRIEFQLGESLEVRVVDNGDGLLNGATRGLGWQSMSDRAAELGGSCSVLERSGGGIVVHGTLPLGHNGAMAPQPGSQP